MTAVSVSPAFRKLTIRAMLSILLFIFVYLLLFALSIGLTVLCGWLAMVIVSLQANAVTVGLGLGLLCMGLLTTYFLLKFIFARNRSDLSHLTEITRREEPRLFAMIDEIVQEVKTDFPKKIYLSADVNAAVFYDSSFWSMFFPVRKNLQIGLGLVNSVTQLELKAILAHEFGHFSQRSMKLGSYVYNVNKVIYNMLYDNESYNRQVEHLANLSGYIAFFARMAMGIVQGIQWVLKKMYHVVNLAYMGLSREMEFHADEVAAQVAGSGPLISSLLRLNLSNEALGRVTDFYNQRYQQSVISTNIYPQQRWMMEYLSTGSGLALAAGLPVLTEAHYERYNKSKLVIKDQWASHPTTEDRIAALNRLHMRREDEKPEPANNIFENVRQRQEAATSEMFAAITFPAAVVPEDEGTFKEAYLKENPLYLFPAIFNGYYDHWDPVACKPGDPMPETTAKKPRELFSDEMVNLVHSLAILERDKAVLHQLTVSEHDIKTFDYDGVKYSMDNIYALTERLDGILADSRDRLRNNDNDAHAFFRQHAITAGKVETWEKQYGVYANVQLQAEERIACFNAVVEAIQFMQEQLPYAQIELRLPSLAVPEKNFKTCLTAVLEDEAFQQVLQPEQKDLFTKYISLNTPYFNGEAYNDEAVDVLYGTLGIFPRTLAHACMQAKLAFLECCAELVEEKAIPAGI